MAPDRSSVAGPAVFVMKDTLALGERVCRALGQAPWPHEETDFDDGEHRARPLADVRDRNAFVLQSLYGDPLHGVGDKLCRLLFFIATLKDAGAASVTAVVPYLAFARMDRRIMPADSLTLRHVAALFESAGADAVVTLDVHNLAAFENAFRCRTVHLMPDALFAAAVAPMLVKGAPSVLAPDAGARHRAFVFRLSLAALLDRPGGTAIAETHRQAGQLSGQLMAGEIAGRDMVIVDDLIASGATMSRTAAHCRELGASSVLAVATHGLFAGDANQVLSDAAIDHLIVSDTVPPFRLAHGALRDKLLVVGTAQLIAGAIRAVPGA